MSLEAELPVDGDACRKLLLTLTLPRHGSRKNRGRVFSTDEQRLLFVNFLGGKTSFLMPQRGKRACDRVVDQSHSSFCSHTPELCLSLTDSVDEFRTNTVNVLKQKP